MVFTFCATSDIVVNSVKVTIMTPAFALRAMAPSMTPAFALRAMAVKAGKESNRNLIILNFGLMYGRLASIAKPFETEIEILRSFLIKQNSPKRFLFSILIIFWN